MANVMQWLTLNDLYAKVNCYSFWYQSIPHMGLL